MKYRAPSWWKPVADAARRRDHASAYACHVRGEPFDPARYATLEAAYWRAVEEAHG